MNRKPTKSSKKKKKKKAEKVFGKGRKSSFQTAGGWLGVCWWSPVK